MLVVVITGSRSWTNPKPIHAAIHGADLLIVGDCLTGADAIALAFARANDVMCAPMVADWQKLGNPGAAHARNQAIADRAAAYRNDGLPVRCYAFPLPESKGTWDCVRQLRAHGLRVEIAQLSGQMQP